MKTFGELETGDTLYAFDSYINSSDKWEVGKVLKYKAIITRKDSTFVNIKIDNFYGNGAEHEFNAKLTDTIGRVAPSLEGVKEYWKQQYSYQAYIIKSKEQELENMKKEFAEAQKNLDKILQATETE